jgi:hypothetical protein
MPALMRQRQEDCKFKPSLGYIARPYFINQNKREERRGEGRGKKGKEGEMRERDYGIIQ